MPFDSAREAGGGDVPDPGDEDHDHESVIREIQAAADAAVERVRKIAATASAEARVNIESAVAMASATLIGVAMVIVAWACIVVLGVWFAVDAGWPVPAALMTAALSNVAAAVLCRVWYARLSRNIGFARTVGLLLGRGEPGPPRYSGEHWRQ